MKKILVIMIMVLLCSTAVMGQNKKRSARKPKAKTERAMTDFEKRQKEEYLANILMWCQHYYNEGDIDEANYYKNKYEEVKRKNYYVEFTNIEHSKKEKEYYKKELGIELRDGQRFYVDGLEVFIYFDHEGKACDRTDYSFMCLEYKVKKELIGYDTRTYYNAKKALIDEINELSGYNAKLAKKTNEMEEFIKTTKVEQEVSQIQNRAKQQIKEQANEVRYFNMAGQEVYNPDDYPCDLIVVTTYTDGRMRTTRVIK